MSNWYSKVSADPNDLSPVADAYEYFDRQYEDAKRDLEVLTKKGAPVSEVIRRIPGLTEYRYGQLSEIEAIIGYLEIIQTKAQGIKRKHYLEAYNRQLSDRMVELYSASDPAVADLGLLRNQFSLIRNKFLGVHKGLETLHYQIGHLVKLLEKGIEDSSL